MAKNEQQFNEEKAVELEAQNTASVSDDPVMPPLADTDLQTPQSAESLAVQSASAAENVSDGTGEIKLEEETLADRARIVSPFKLVIKRFFRSRLSVIGLSVFIAVLVFSFLGPVFVPWGSQEVDRSEAQRAEYSFIRDTIVVGEQDSAENGETDDYMYYLIGYSKPTECNSHAKAGTYGINSKGERALHVLGTDNAGYDIFVRIMYGGRLSLLLSFIVVLVYTILGVILGGLAGYFGGWVDMIIMRLVDIINCIPSLPILLIIGAILAGNNVDPNLRIYFLMGALTLLSWAGTARLVRGQILFLREQEYMVAADALGFSSARKIFKHLVPNVFPQLIVSMTLGLGGTILTEASLSFLGLGTPMEVASLGQMVSLATKSLTIMEIYIADWLPAGIIIILAVVAFNFIGDGLRDALDPKMKR